MSHPSSRPTVIKYGGAAMKDEGAARALMGEIASLHRGGSPIIVVHGGGPEIDALLLRLGITPRKERGMRVTDEATMEVVEMVLAGKVNKRLVSLLSSHGVDAVGLSGKDGNLFETAPLQLDGIDLGFVAEVTGVNQRLLVSLLDNHFLPVVCSVGADSAGHSVNINADLAAAAIARSLQAQALVLLTDIPGVMSNYPDPASVISQMTVEETKSLLLSGKIDSGMLPKLQSSIDVIEGGVAAAYILDGRRPELLGKALAGETGLGTVITP